MKSRILYITVTAILVISYLAAQPPETTTQFIHIQKDGSARVEVERRLILETEEDEKAFENLQMDKTLKDEKLLEFKEKINLLVEKAKYATQRSMEATDFDIFFGKETTVTKTYGVIKFRFTWKKFANVEKNTIIGGDVFKGGYYLSKNEILIFTFPEDFELIEVSPIPHQQQKNMVMWEGPWTFQFENPSFIIKKIGSEPEPTEESIEKPTEESIEKPTEESIEKPTEKGFLGNKKMFILAAVLILGGLLVLVFRSKKGTGAPVEEPQQVDDEKLIIDIIKQHGGTIPQKKLPELTGFSKAKVSLILKELKEKGTIRKRFRGRENLIKLIES
jgi:uncharacterized membrane protein